MGKLKRKWKKKSLYKKTLIIFSTFLIMLSVLFLLYVTSTMVEYEESLVDNHIKKIVENGELADLSTIEDFDTNKYETSNMSASKGLKKMLKSSDDIVIEKVANKKNTYEVFVNDASIATVKLKKVGSTRKMAILTIDKWKVDSIESDFKRGIYYYDINIPTNYKLFINGKSVDDKDITKSSDVSDLDRMTEYVEICKTNYYVMDNFVKKPDIKIEDESGKSVDYEIKDNKIEITKEFKTYDSYDEMKDKLAGDIDVLGLAEKWSLFLTDDLKGPWHGFTELSNYLINDSYMYKMAYNWAHNVDITFVSNHSLKNPIFTNEFVKNCTLYNELAFSCEVNLEKNMRVNGNDKVDKLHDYMYFVYYNGGFKLVDMKSVTD